ncbi:hypothetical protein LX36DRAFT_697730 [Colletotrichum falcatum]|nr:hypothetical protein LX36DRAFT_697730 [Colletotrichum falcatum]
MAGLPKGRAAGLWDTSGIFAGVRPLSRATYEAEGQRPQGCQALRGDEWYPCDERRSWKKGTPRSHDDTVDQRQDRYPKVASLRRIPCPMQDDYEYRYPVTRFLGRYISAKFKQGTLPNSADMGKWVSGVMQVADAVMWGSLISYHYRLGIEVTSAWAKRETGTLRAAPVRPDCANHHLTDETQPDAINEHEPRLTARLTEEARTCHPYTPVYEYQSTTAAWHEYPAEKVGRFANSSVSGRWVADTPNTDNLSKTF